MLLKPIWLTFIDGVAFNSNSYFVHKKYPRLNHKLFIGGFCLMLGWLLVQTKLCTTNYQRMKNSPGYSCPSNWGIFRKCTYL